MNFGKHLQHQNFASFIFNLAMIKLSACLSYPTYHVFCGQGEELIRSAANFSNFSNSSPKFVHRAIRAVLDGVMCRKFLAANQLAHQCR